MQLWNRSLLDNLLYGADGPPDIGQALALIELYELLHRLPDGLQTSLGEGGGLLSGGEGQRVRLGRSVLRPRPRLVILDEPFRGLDRARRRELLRRARELWQGSTLLCVTHDVGETRDFGRVLVLEGGRVAEDGPPARLANAPDSLYSRMPRAENDVMNDLWGNPCWRQLRLEGGRLDESVPGGDP